MSTKQFLPLNRFDVESTTAPADKPGHLARVPSALGSFLRKILPILGFGGLIIGTTVLGFSLHYIDDQHVGYYKNEPGYVKPGMYLQFPWNSGSALQLVNVGSNKTISMYNVKGITYDDEFYDVDLVNVKYSVVNVSEYVDYVKETGDAFRCELDLKHYFTNAVALAFGNMTGPEFYTGNKQVKKYLNPGHGISIKAVKIEGIFISKKFHLHKPTSVRATMMVPTKPAEPTTKPSTTTTTTKPSTTTTTEPTTTTTEPTTTTTTEPTTTTTTTEPTTTTTTENPSAVITEETYTTRFRPMGVEDYEDAQPPRSKRSKRTKRV